MGFADVVPGVSGGTVAFVLGIYERLIGAIGNVDRTFIQLIRTFQFKKAAVHIDLRFLMALGCGIVTGIGAMAILIHSLLESESGRMYTYAAFFGMILASAWVLARSLKIPSPNSIPKYWTLGILGTIISAVIAFQTAEHVAGQPHMVYLFVCGMIGICAMILPGISGAMLLVLLGVYGFLSGIPDQIKSGDDRIGALVALAIFGCGCLVGILSFAKFLRWLLKTYSGGTMAFLCGLMIGALPRVFPYQRDLDPSIVEFKDKKFSPMLPEAFDGTMVALIGIAVVAAALVLIAHRFSGQQAMTNKDSMALAMDQK